MRTFRGVHILTFPFLVKDRRESEKRPDLSISLHGYKRKMADHLFFRFARVAGERKGDSKAA